MALSIGTGRRRQRSTVLLFTREQCGLCAAAEEIVRAEAGRSEVRFIDIDTDEELVKRYHIRVPVVVIDGREVAEGNVQPGQVRAALRRARKDRWADWRRA